MRAILVTITFTNGDCKKLLLNSFKELKETRKDVKSIKGLTIKL